MAGRNSPPSFVKEMSHFHHSLGQKESLLSIAPFDGFLLCESSGLSFQLVTNREWLCWQVGCVQGRDSSGHGQPTFSSAPLEQGSSKLESPVWQSCHTSGGRCGIYGEMATCLYKLTMVLRHVIPLCCDWCPYSSIWLYSTWTWVAHGNSLQARCLTFIFSDE